MSGTYGELEFLASTLKGYHTDCLDSHVDFSKVTFHCTDTSMWLELKDGTFSRPLLYFRINPLDTKDPIAVNAHKQLCKLLQVPHAFFSQNRPKMRETVVRNWVAGLEPEEDASRRVMKIRTCREMNVIRAILPTNYVDYPNYRAVESFIKDGEQLSMVMTSIVGEDMDAHTTELVVKIGDSIDWCGKSYHIGLSMTFSDITTKNLLVDSLLIADDGSDTLTVTFEHGHMLDLPYPSMTPADMDKVLSGLPQQITDLKPVLIERLLQSAGQEFSGIEDSIDIVCSQIRSPAVKRRLRREFLREGAAEDYPSAVAFARGVATVAKSYDGQTRTMLEGLAGSFIRLDLPVPVPATADQSTTEAKK